MNAISQHVLPSSINPIDQPIAEYIIVEGSVRLNDEIFRSKKFRSLIARLLSIQFVDLAQMYLSYESPNLHMQIQGELAPHNVDAVELVLAQMDVMIWDQGLGDPEHMGLYFPVHVFPIREDQIST